jgi:hypothetical protein
MTRARDHPDRATRLLGALLALLVGGWPLLAVPLTLLAKTVLVDIDPRARWAQAWLRAQPSGNGATRGAGRQLPD